MNNTKNLIEMSLGNMIDKICMNSNPCLPKIDERNYQPFYFGAAQSLDPDPNILTIGTTAQDAIDRYMQYAEKHRLQSPWKIYPISFTLWRAMQCVDGDNFPKTVLLEVGDEDKGYDYNAASGMVDLLRRVHQYPSVAALRKIGIEYIHLLQRLYPEQYEKYINVYFQVMYHNHTVISMELIRDVEKDHEIKYWLDNSPDLKEGTEEQLDNRLFNFWYSVNRISFTSNYTHVTEIPLEILMSKEFQNNIVDFRLDVSILSESGKETCVREDTLSCVFPFTDTPAIVMPHFASFI